MDQGPSPPDEALARALRRADREAGETLVRRWGRSVYAYCRSILGRAADAEDACQEVFFRMVRNIGRYDNRRPFGAWLIGIARNVCRSERDKHRRTAVPLDRAPQPAPDAAEPGETALRREQEGEVARAIEALPERYQELLLYKFKMNLPNSEIASLLQIAPQSLCVYYQRAMKLLREKVKERHGPPSDH